MVTKTVLIFPTRVPDMIVKKLEELCEERDDKNVHIEDLKSHTITLISLEQMGNNSVNDICKSVLGYTNMEVVKHAYDQSTNTTYVRLGQKVNAQLQQAGLDQVRKLF